MATLSEVSKNVYASKNQKMIVRKLPSGKWIAELDDDVLITSKYKEKAIAIAELHCDKLGFE